MNEIVLPLQQPRVVRRRVVHHLRLFALLFAAACAVWLAGFATADQRSIFTPAALIVAIALFFAGQLYDRDGVLPLFEVGTMFVAAASVYSLVPLLSFVTGGMTFAIPFADPRLQAYAPSAAEVGAFSYRYVLYLACFAAAYLLVRRRARPVGGAVPHTDQATVVAIVICVLAGSAYLFALNVMAGSISNPYAGGTGLEWRERLPYFVLQITNVVVMTTATLELVLPLVLVTRWRSWPHRLVLFAWIVFEIVMTFRILGSRTTLVRLLLVIGMSYHRFVRPLSLKVAVAAGAVVLGGFVLYGAARDVGGFGALRTPGVRPLALNNEFEVLFANAFDLHQKKMDGLQAPWQIYVSDVYMLVPSQLLPFQKIDPADWYVDSLGLGGTGVGLMFGAIAQGVVGFDWIELAVRGAILGICFALFHRLYVRRSHSFWLTALYVCVCAWSYYSFRATSFYLLYFVVYYFGAAFVVINVLRLLLLRVHRRLVT
jgi:hypothetical protein